MKLKRPREAGLTAAIKAAGTLHELGVMLGITAQAVSGWRRIPAERVLEVERVTGLTRSVLRPDLYPADDSRERHVTLDVVAEESSLDETHAEEAVRQDDGGACSQGELKLQAAE